MPTGNAVASARPKKWDRKSMSPNAGEAIAPCAWTKRGLHNGEGGNLPSPVSKCSL
eukprot:CAMPEP_0174366672 /NCGR_PEP_ID=MMETSP0811_2-20130205/82137_1 /TAXON_ID=73025 ORGANISM="Eutreptiella gymnastica-like, Strain CCMP1594" /NCGR_SAMPLE_ID=MMETSP0811_2 /ASSEMBLY_ACC=CAM_ASM_000667 /LENGTH=55 /DNA_ID=CAMNT_0015508457 /DNA_START=206 /DNA_END=373 /DNA_ORIENTATION=-